MFTSSPWPRRTNRRFQGEDEVISSAGAKVLRRIAKARDYIHQSRGDAAINELQQASALLASINRALPTSVIKGQIAAGKRQLEQEGTTDLVPIATSLDELGGSLPVTDGPGRTWSRAIRRAR